MKILVLTIQTNEYKFVNNFLIPESLHRQGHEVVLGDVETSSYLEGAVHCRQAMFHGAQSANATLSWIRWDRVRSSISFGCSNDSHPDRERNSFSSCGCSSGDTLR